jgi:hypothetical protein
MRFILPLAILGVALTSAFSAGSVSAGASCGRAGYSYAGFQALSPARGVRAELVALGRPHVENGHVAAWVGVGGPGQGAGGSDAWIQVGLSAFRGTGSRLYYETNRPGVGPRYTEVRSEVPAGARVRMGVVEMVRRPGWWRVWVDGRPVSDPVYLPGSTGRWRPIATAETWDGGSRVCNLFAYSFNRVSVAPDRRHGWRRFAAGHRFQDPGYRVLTRQRGGFIARGTRPLPKTADPAAHKQAPQKPKDPSAQDTDGSSGTNVPLQEQDGAVGDTDATVGDRLP